MTPRRHDPPAADGTRLSPLRHSLRSRLRDDSRVISYSHSTYTLLRGPVEPKQFTSWAFSQNVRDARIAPSMGAVGSAYDNARMESFWARVQVELLNRRRWKTRIELATAIHDYIELFHNTQRRRSALGMRTPNEVEAGWLKSQEERLPARTAPDRAADEASSPGLSDPQVQDEHRHHLELMNSNNRAA